MHVGLASIPGMFIAAGRQHLEQPGEREKYYTYPATQG